MPAVRLIHLLPVAALLALPAAAQEPRTGTYSFQLDNDLFANTDRHYTSGIRGDWISAPGDLPDWLAAMAPHLTLLPRPTAFRYGYTLGQSIYTPNDIKRSNPDPADRPYAGWLYGGMGIYAEQDTVVDSLELKIGIVGPESFAEQTQKGVHSLIGSPRPRGWRHQLDNEPGLVLSYERQWQDAVQIPLHGFCLDAAPRVGAVVGNVFTYAAAGATVRFGKDVPDDFGPPLLRPTSIGAAPRVSGVVSATDGCSEVRNNGERASWGWYLFGSLEGRAVAHNIFLDGNSFGNTPKVDRSPLVADLQVGLVVYVDWLKLSYSRVFRTREFDGQSAVDSFGSVGVSFNF